MRKVRVFSKSNKLDCHFTANIRHHLLPMIKLEISKQNKNFGKFHKLLDVLRFSDETAGDTNKCDFLTLYNEMY